MGQVIKISTPQTQARADEAEHAHAMLDTFDIERVSEGQSLTVAGRIAALIIRMAEAADHAMEREARCSRAVTP